MPHISMAKCPADQGKGISPPVRARYFRRCLKNLRRRPCQIQASHLIEVHSAGAPTKLTSRVVRELPDKRLSIPRSLLARLLGFDHPSPNFPVGGGHHGMTLCTEAVRATLSNSTIPLRLHCNFRGPTVHGYETNIRAHYLPEFGDMQLSEISIEVVQAFLNQKATEGKAVQTLKNLKWGLSSIFVAAAKYGYMMSNPARGTDLPPEQIREQKALPTIPQLSQLIERLKEPISTAVWLVAVSCVRPEELAFKWKDLDAAKRELWVVRAVNQGKLHTPKYHRANRPIRLTEADVKRLLALKAWKKAKDDDWVFPNRLKTGPIWHETLLARRIQPVARELGLPHVTWRLLRHWGATQMVEARVPLKAAQERLGHSRPDILLKYYAHVLDASADVAAETLSGQLSGSFGAAKTA